MFKTLRIDTSFRNMLTEIITESTRDERIMEYSSIIYE